MQAFKFCVAIEFCDKIKFSTIKFYEVAEFYAMKFCDLAKLFGNVNFPSGTAIKF
ncbi:hypothetical protein [uncultured Campylobacter sp.]|uniref:hypothetical protein n=1 Tax=uncultured Campylobacter sp. TaxID=218934 RepID=UPI00262B85EB|nr:hypothetical protein [uncultured Campylobacter sp.]